jgi:hypothetical protein
MFVEKYLLPIFIHAIDVAALRGTHLCKRFEFVEGSTLTQARLAELLKEVVGAERFLQHRHAFPLTLEYTPRS